MSDSDDAPEELTQEQAKLQDSALRKIQRENTSRVTREKKERRKRLAERLTPRKSKKVETFEEEEEPEKEKEKEEDSASLVKRGFLPENIINFLAEREKKKVWSDSKEEEEEVKEEIPIKKKQKSSGIETVIYKEIPPPACTKSASDFLNKRRSQVPRSSSVLKKSS